MNTLRFGLVALVLAACGAAAPASSDVAEEPTANAGTADDAAATTADGTAEAPAAANDGFEGEWLVDWSEDQKKGFKVLEMALKGEVPADEELKKQGMSDEDIMGAKMMAGMMQMMPKDDPKRKEMEDMLGNLDKMGMTLTADTITMSLGPKMSMTGKMEVLEKTDSMLKIKITREDGESDEAMFEIKDGKLVMPNPDPKAKDPLAFKRK